MNMVDELSEQAKRDLGQAWRCWGAEGKNPIDAMDQRLYRWGFWCKAGAPVPGEERGGAGMTRDAIADAWKIQCMVMRLPVEQRMVVQVQYVSRPEQAITKWQEVNQRLAAYARAAGLLPFRHVRKDDFGPMRDRALNMLVNQEHALGACPGSAA